MNGCHLLHCILTFLCPTLTNPHHSSPKPRQNLTNHNPWQDEGYETKNAGRQSRKPKGKQQQQAKAAPKQRRNQKRSFRKGDGAMDEMSARLFYEQMFGADVVIMKGPGGRNIVMPKSALGGMDGFGPNGASAEDQERVRQRQRAARRPASDDPLTATIRAALRRDPAVGLKRLAKIVKAEGHVAAGTREVRAALAALEAQAPPSADEGKDPFERMMMMRDAQREKRKHESRQAMCLVLLALLAFVFGVWTLAATLDK